MFTTMTFTTSKLTELPLRSSVFSNPKSSFHTLKPLASSLRTNTSKTPTANHRHSDLRQFQNSKPSAPWLSKWAPSSAEKLINSNGRKQTNDDRAEARHVSKDKGQSAIERIVYRLRNLGLVSDDDKEEEDGEMVAGGSMSVTGEEKLGDLLKREWVRPDSILTENETDELVLPWERDEDERAEEDGRRMKKRTVKAPTLAELTIQHEELLRLRKMGMYIRERINVPKAGLTQLVLQKMHDKWKKEELVRLKFHEVLAHDMKTAHELVERRTGGLVLWRSGSVMVVYRGSNYEGPSKLQLVDRERDDIFVPDVSSVGSAVMRTGDDSATSTPGKSEPPVRNSIRSENMAEEEVEYNALLDGLGPRFAEWWGTGVLPVDADLLPEKIPGYKTPFRLLPTGMRARLTNAEMTNLRKLAKSLPSHFALGRNRNHQGLAAAILKLWEKSLVAKIAVKRGIQNTNNKIMAEELKMLTGGVLLLRNKYFIVIYRGKDFLPTSVAAALAERQQLTKQIQDVEERVRSRVVEGAPLCENGQASAGTLAEFYEAQARWGRDTSVEEREKMIEEASKAKRAKLVRQIEHKISVAQTKKLRAEKLLAKIEASMLPAGPDYDQETITDEERVMFRRVGLRMKAYLPLGIRGVFDGVIENMHLHWKHRELVKLISKQKTLAFVEDTARLLEYESGGVLVAIERVPKGYAIIYYRGKNYQRPISLRPRNLLTKAKALKRYVAMQRHEALSQHISELEKTIEQLKKEIGVSEDGRDEDNWGSSEDHYLSDSASEFTQSEDEASSMASDGDNDDDGLGEQIDLDANEDSESSSFEKYSHPFSENC